MKNNNQKIQSLDFLKKYLKEGDTLYTTVRHVARSGMSRVIKFFVIKENQILDLSFDVSQVIDATYKEKWSGVNVKGCGMDMCFASVYQIACALFDDGYKLQTGYL